MVPDFFREPTNIISPEISIPLEFLSMLLWDLKDSLEQKGHNS